MSNGRSEKRIVRTVSVEVRLQDEPKLNERMLTENVSAHGARVFMERKLQPGQQSWLARQRRACAPKRGSSTACAGGWCSPEWKAFLQPLQSIDDSSSR
jgi:hypothetical protein